MIKAAQVWVGHRRATTKLQEQFVKKEKEKLTNYK